MQVITLLDLKWALNCPRKLLFTKTDTIADRSGILKHHESLLKLGRNHESLDLMFDYVSRTTENES